MAASNPEPIRLGVIGCGRIAQAAHLPAIAKTDAAELVAVADQSAALVQGVASRYGVTAYSDAADLLNSTVDAVLIAAPDRFHFDLGTAALQAGKHVLMEKPLAATSQLAEGLAALAAERGLRLQTGAMKRHDPAIAFAHDHLGPVGAVISYSSVYRVPAMRAGIEDTLFPPQMIIDDAVRMQESTLKAQANRASYLLATHGAHVFDTMCYFAGRPSWVSAHAAVVGADHTWHGVAGLPGGGLASFEMTVDVHADWAEGFELFGTRGHIKARTFQPFWKRASDVEVYLEEPNTSMIPHPADTNAYKLQIESFVEAIRAGGGENPSPEDGVWAVRLIEAAGRSVALAGEKVEL